MEKMSIPLFYLEKKGIKGYVSIDDFIESVKEREIYLVDSQSFRGRDINLRVLSRLASLYDVWFDSNVRWRDDVYDIILTGAKVAVLSGRKVNEKFLRSIMETTDNVALKSNDEELVREFVSMGGRIVITDLNIDVPKRYMISEGRLIEI